MQYEVKITNEIRNECVKLVEDYFQAQRGQEIYGCGFRADDGDHCVIVEVHVREGNLNYRTEVDARNFSILRTFVLETEGEY